MLSPFLSHYANILVLLDILISLFFLEVRLKYLAILEYLLDILISLFFLEVSNYKATYAKQAIHLHKSVTI